MMFNFFFFFQAEDGIRDKLVTGVQTCALPILRPPRWRWYRSPHGRRARRPHRPSAVPRGLIRRRRPGQAKIRPALPMPVPARPALRKSLRPKPRLQGATLEGISANLYGDSIKTAMLISAPAALPPRAPTA